MTKRIAAARRATANTSTWTFSGWARLPMLLLCCRLTISPIAYATASAWKAAAW